MAALVWVAWGMLTSCFAGFVVALHVGESCATSVGPYLAAGMFAAWVFLTLHYEKGRR